jgi:hypothetical protein
VQDAMSIPLIVDEFGHPIGKAAETNKIQTTQREILNRVKTGERWMIILTAVVAATSIFQAVQSCNNNRSTSSQIDKIIGSANQIGSAAGSFSASAQGINQGIGNAVGQLQSQASKMDASRKAADKNSADAIQATIDSFHTEQRAWIGISDAKPVGFTANADKSVSLVVAFTFRNYGHSAAEYVHFFAALESDPTIYSRSCDEATRSHGGDILLPTQQRTMNWVMNLTREQMEKGWSHQNPLLGNNLFLKIIGCIEYSDRNGEIPPHRTPFSYMVLPSTTAHPYITPDANIPVNELVLETIGTDSNQTH